MAANNSSASSLLQHRILKRLKLTEDAYKPHTTVEALWKDKLAVPLINAIGDYFEHLTSIQLQCCGNFLQAQPGMFLQASGSLSVDLL